ncbi:MAG: FAD-dependent oxidoreductase [Candidatus Kariarchaeaceae archaeon]
MTMIKGSKKPIIITIDDEVQVLNAIERDLRTNYGRDYRIIKANSGREAITTVEKLKARNETVALFVADQRMPDIDGTEVLEQVLKLYPDAKKILLTAYADTKAAITSINSIGLDYYLTKPWDPPEELLYPVLDDLLDDWQAYVDQPYDGIRIAGNLWSRKSHDIKDFLAKNRVPYQWLDLEKDQPTVSLLESLKLDRNKLPIVFFEDGSHLIQPTRSQVAEKIGMQTEATTDFYDLIIIGAGPAGLAAGVYGASEGLRSLIIEKQATGGQAGTSSRIENYLGFPKGLSGADLARRAQSQAERLGAEILLPQEVVKVDLDGNYKIITLKNGKELRSYSIVLASGVEVRRFNVPGEDKLVGAGVYYGAAMTEAAYYKGEEIYVLGGGNSAGQGAMFFSRYAKKVNIVIRRSSLVETMSQYLIEQLDATENIELIPNTTIQELKGETKLEGLTLKDAETGEEKDVNAAAIFIFIGAAPRTEIIEHLVERDEKGYIKTGLDLIEGRAWRKKVKWIKERDPFTFETSVPGIFAAGDVRYDSSKRVAAAVGEGAVAVRLIHQYLREV